MSEPFVVTASASQNVAFEPYLVVIAATDSGWLTAAWLLLGCMLHYPT